MSKVGVCIPWRSTPSRARHLPTVQDHLRWLLPDAQHYLADSGHDIFNRSASTNLAVATAAADGCGLLIVTGADLLLYSGDLPAVLDQAERDGRAHIAYVGYMGLSQAGTDRFYETGTWLGCDVAYTTNGAVGGYLAMRADTYDQVGGFDESYVGWGHEDVDFAVRAQLVRHGGICVALWHAEDPDKAEHAPANAARFHARHPTGAAT